MSDKKSKSRKAVEAYRSANGAEHIHADPLGSYTGIAVEGTPFTPPELVYPEGVDNMPVQDADDL